MTREQNLLIKKLKSLSPEEIASVRQFMESLTASRSGPAPAATVMPVQAAAAAAGGNEVRNAPGTGSAQPAGSTAPEVQTPGSAPGSAPVSAPVCAAGAGWRRRPFQAVDADDLQPIAELFREALDSRAAARLRYGSR
jgi:hypothetical protein